MFFASGFLGVPSLGIGLFEPDLETSEELLALASEDDGAPGGPMLKEPEELLCGFKGFGGPAPPWRAVLDDLGEGCAWVDGPLKLMFEEL